MQVNISSFLPEIRIHVRQTQYFSRMCAKLTKVVFLGYYYFICPKGHMVHRKLMQVNISSFLPEIRIRVRQTRMCAQLTKVDFLGWDQLH